MKKADRQKFLAILTFGALFVLMAVQFSWLFRAAALEEQNFSHRVSMALKESREEIAKRVPRCNNMKNYLCGRPCHKEDLNKTVAEIDSILCSKLENNNIKLNYTFSIASDTIVKSDKKGVWFKTKCYQQSLNGLLEKKGIQLALNFPDRNQFILSQIKGAFVISMLAIAFVMVSFFITFRLFKKERETVAHTTDFINNMVHEFQTPLANIKLATGLIRKRRQGSDEKITEYTDVILKENHKLQSRVEEILNFSNGEKNTAICEIVNVHDILRSVADDYHPRLTAQNASLILKLDAKQPQIKIDKRHIALIVSNLLDNALKYSNEDPEIIMETTNHADRFYLSIKDNGIGISKSDIERIFDKYYRVSTGNVHNVKGFGLGLTYVKRMVNEYGGEISVESTVNKGSTFTLFFPQKDL